MMRRKNKKLYKLAIVTFVDLLGFRDFVNKKSDIAVLDMLGKFEYFNGVKRDPKYTNMEDMKPKFIKFSDSLVRIRFLKDVDSECFKDDRVNFSGFLDLFVYELIDLIHAQGELSHNDILLRGGITIGDVYLDQSENTIFGPALIRAYELESIHAKYPRIIIDPKIFEIIDSLHDHINDASVLYGLEEDIEHLKNLIKCDKGEEFYFVDYLRIFFNEVDYGYQSIFISKHKEIIESRFPYIEDNSAKNKNPPSLREKWKWLANYHNDTIDHLYTDGKEGEKVKRKMSISLDFHENGSNEEG